jgi:hypothetical protein
LVLLERIQHFLDRRKKMNNFSVEMIPVTSSNVEAIGYDETNQHLYIQFLNNTVYVYKGVPINEFNGLKNAPSIGAYIHRNIRNLFPYERIQ